MKRCLLLVILLSVLSPLCLADGTPGVAVSGTYTVATRVRVLTLAATGDALADGRRLKAAADSAQPGDIILLGAGVFDLGHTWIRLPDGGSLQGQGPAATEIRTQWGLIGSLGHPFCIEATSGSTLKDLAVTANAGRAEQVYQYVYGTYGNIVGATIENVRIRGQSDGIFVAGSGSLDLTILNSEIVTMWDAIQSAHNPATIKIRCSTIRVILDPGLSCIGTAIQGSADLVGCTIEVAAGQGMAYGIQAMGKAVATLRNCTIRTTGEPAMDLRGCVTATDCVFSKRAD